MGKTLELKLPNKGSETYFVCADVHSDKIHLPTFKIMLELAQRCSKKPNLIINGDLLDVDWLFKKNEAYLEFKKRPNGVEDYFIPSFDQEMEWGNWFLGQIEPYFKKVYYLLGNHDARIPWFAESKDCPYAYKPYFNLEKALKLKERGVVLAGQYNDWIDLGELSLTHGMYHGATSCKKHYEASGGKSVLFGHIHKLGVAAYTSRGMTKQVTSLPCMSTLNPDYTRNAENDWSNGFATVVVKPNGNFNLHPYQVWDEELLLPGGDKLTGSKIKLTDMPIGGESGQEETT